MLFVAWTEEVIVYWCYSGEGRQTGAWSNASAGPWMRCQLRWQTRIHPSHHEHGRSRPAWRHESHPGGSPFEHLKLYICSLLTFWKISECQGILFWLEYQGIVCEFCCLSGNWRFRMLLLVKHQWFAFVTDSKCNNWKNVAYLNSAVVSTEYV